MKPTLLTIAVVAGLALGLYALDLFIMRSFAKQKIRDTNEAIRAGWPPPCGFEKMPMRSINF